MKTKTLKEIQAERKNKADKEQRFRRYTLLAHKIECDLIKLILLLDNEKEKTKSERFLRHALDLMKKATRLLATQE